jgi:hypothetical protein
MLKEKEKLERRMKLAEEREAFGEEEIPEEETSEEGEEEEPPLPEIFMPPTPSPILCGFYSEPGKFWVSLVSNNPFSSPGYGCCFSHPVHPYAYIENLILD